MSIGAKNNKAKVIKASMDLPMRVGMGRVDENIIDNAQKVMDQNEVVFGEIAQDDLSVLSQSIEMTKDVEDNTVDHLPKDDLVRSIMNLKANAGSFHFPLISDIGGLVLTAIEKSPNLNRELMDIVELLYHSIHNIITDDMRGNGGTKGKELGRAFRELCSNYEKKLT